MASAAADTGKQRVGLTSADLVAGRAVVTGGAGFLGSHLCRRLLELGCEVVCVDNLITGSEANMAGGLQNRAMTFVKHDISRALQVDGDVDYVLNFASPASPDDYHRWPIQTLKVGSLGTHNALGLAMAKSARFLLASTSEVYGDPDVHPQPESYWGHVNPVGPRGVYDEAKRVAEAFTMAYHRHHGLDTRIMRIFNTYGPGMRVQDGRSKVERRILQSMSRRWKCLSTLAMWTMSAPACANYRKWTTASITTCGGLIHSWTS